jgi:hypothetical protein
MRELAKQKMKRKRREDKIRDDKIDAKESELKTPQFS